MTHQGVKITAWKIQGWLVCSYTYTKKLTPEKFRLKWLKFYNDQSCLHYLSLQFKNIWSFILFPSIGILQTHWQHDQVATDLIAQLIEHCTGSLRSRHFQQLMQREWFWEGVQKIRSRGRGWGKHPHPLPLLAHPLLTFPNFLLTLGELLRLPAFSLACSISEETVAMQAMHRYHRGHGFKSSSLDLFRLKFHSG